MSFSTAASNAHIFGSHAPSNIDHANRSLGIAVADLAKATEEAMSILTMQLERLQASIDALARK